MSDAIVPIELGGLTPSFDPAYELLAEYVLGQKRSNVISLLNDVASSVRIKHIAHLVSFRKENADSALLNALTTYSREWQVKYFRLRYDRIDPIFAACLQAESPFDWRIFRGQSSEGADFLADAAANGVGLSGYTIPVRGGPKGNATVSFTSDLTDDSWNDYILRYEQNLKVLACLIHAAAGQTTTLASKQIDLSNRERQALTWAARGNTNIEIAELMDVSYASVRTYIENARRKLACGNVTHAVATAMAIGLISPMSQKGFDPSGYTGKSADERAA